MDNNKKFLLEEMKVDDKLKFLTVSTDPGYIKIQGNEYIVSEDLEGFPLGDYIIKLNEDHETADKAFVVLNASEVNSKEKWAQSKMILELKRIV